MIRSLNEMISVAGGPLDHWQPLPQPELAHCGEPGLTEHQYSTGSGFLSRATLHWPGSHAI
jgi:hypothetical protein